MPGWRPVPRFPNRPSGFAERALREAEAGGSRSGTAQMPRGSDSALFPARGLVYGPRPKRPEPAERCQSGRSGRSRKPLCVQAYRGFESHPLRHFARRGFRTFRYPDSAGAGGAGTSAVSASGGVCALSATPTAALDPGPAAAGCRSSGARVDGHVPILSWNRVGRHKPQHCSGTSSERESGLLQVGARYSLPPRRALRAHTVRKIGPYRMTI